MERSDAEEYTQSLGQIVAGSWRQVALAKRLGVPKALGLSTDEWVNGRLGGYVKLSISERREAVKELAADGRSQREITEITGLGLGTVNRELNDHVPNGTQEAAKGKEASNDSVPNGTPLDAIAALAADEKVKQAAKAIDETVRQIAEAAPDLAQKVKSGELKPAEAKRELKKRQTMDKVDALPDGQYRVIYADPPWKYNDKLELSTKNGGESYGPADAHYRQLSIDELCFLSDDSGRKVADLPADDAVLFLWTTSPILEDTFSVIKAWGFEYKTSFVWDKVKHNMGHYNSVRHEFLLVCTRGSCTPDNSKLFDSVLSIERGEHSAKPKEFREIIDTIYPHGPRIELFARERIAGWDAWGNQA